LDGGARPSGHTRCIWIEAASTTDSVIERVCKRAGLKGVTAHTLRHTFGSIAGELGYSELTIATLLGHTSRSVTQIYVHIENAVRDAAEHVSKAISALLGPVTVIQPGKNDRHRPAFRIDLGRT
jgi:integrase